MVPRCATASSRVMPMPLSRIVRVPAFGVGLDPDAQLPLLAQQRRVGQGQEAQLVVGVGGVGDQLAEEDLAVAVQGMDHELQQLTDLGLEAECFGGRQRSSDMDDSGVEAVEDRRR